MYAASGFCLEDDMELGGEEAISYYISKRVPFYADLFQEEGIVIIAKKDGLPVDSQVVDVVELVGFEVHL